MRKQMRVIAAVLLVTVLSGCTVTTGENAEPPQTVQLAPSIWEPFGPFLKQTGMGDAVSVPGPTTLYVPGAGEVALDAAAMLPEEQILEESYSFTYEEQTPIVAGLIKVKGDSDDGESSRPDSIVVGIRVVDGEARVFTRKDLVTWGPHESSIVGTSLLGVFDVLVEGDLSADPTSEGKYSTQITGTDVARQTHVWREEGARMIPGIDRALWIPDDDPECGAASVNTMTGKKLPLVGSPDEKCLSFEKILDGYGLARDPAGNHVAVDLHTGNRIETSTEVLLVDPKMPLMVAGGWRGEAVTVIDPRDGSVLYEIPAEEVAARKVVVESLYGGKLYLSEKIGQTVVIARSGEEVGTWKTYPIAQVGEYRWMSDATLTRRKLEDEH